MTFNDRTLNEVNIIWAAPLCVCAAVHRPRCPLSASDLCVTLKDSPDLPDHLVSSSIRHSLPPTNSIFFSMCTVHVCHVCFVIFVAVVLCVSVHVCV